MVEQSNTPLNSLYFGLFLMFWACLIIHYVSFRYSWDIGFKKKLKNLILKKG